MTADQILQASHPEALFPNSLDEAKKIYRELALKWHPDRNTDPACGQVFMHLHRLYAQALTKIQTGDFGSIERTFEFGKRVDRPSSLLFQFRPEHKIHFEFASRTLLNFTFASPRMKQEFSRQVPMESVIRKDLSIEIKKPNTYLCLEDVLKYFGGKLEARHSAWVLSRLYNIVCYLSWIEVAHGDISMQNVFIDAEQHHAAIYGGWHFATRFGTVITALPQRSFDALPWEVRRTKKSKTTIDLDLIRLLGKEITKDPPAPMLKWFNGVSKPSASTEFREWTETLEKSFGPRVFVPMNITPEAIYKGA